MLVIHTFTTSHVSISLSALSLTATLPVVYLFIIREPIPANAWLARISVKVRKARRGKERDQGTEGETPNPIPGN